MHIELNKLMDVLRMDPVRDVGDLFDGRHDRIEADAQSDYVPDVGPGVFPIVLSPGADRVAELQRSRAECRLQRGEPSLNRPVRIFA